MMHKFYLLFILILKTTVLWGASIHYPPESGKAGSGVDNTNVSNPQELTQRYPTQSMRAKCTGLSYTPLLELGKEWKYTLWHNAVYRPKMEDREYSLRCEKCEEIDGREYYHVGFYMDGKKVDDDFGYGCETWLWEDIDSHRVYSATFSDEGVRSKLLYDFDNPANSEAEMRVDSRGLEDMAYIRADGESVHAFKCGDSGRYLLAEGIGFISSGEFESDPYAHCFGNLLTGPTLGPSGDAVIDKIYEVVDGNGDIIYSLPGAYPGVNAGIGSILSADVRISVAEGHVDVEGVSPIGDVTVYSTVGAVVLHDMVDTTEYVIDTTRFSPGVYVVRAGTQLCKFTVR